MKHPERLAATLLLSLAVLFPSCVDAKTGRIPAETLPLSPSMSDAFSARDPRVRVKIPPESLRAITRPSTLPPSGDIPFEPLNLWPLAATGGMMIGLGWKAANRGRR